MGKLKGRPKNTLSWVVAGFMALSGVVYFPSFASVLMFLGAILAAPIPPIRDFLFNKGVKGFTKVALIFAVFIASAIAAPTSDTSEEPTDPPAIEEPAETPDEEVEHTEEPSEAPAVVDEASEPEVVEEPSPVAPEENNVVSEPVSQEPAQSEPVAPAPAPPVQEPIQEPVQAPVEEPVQQEPVSKPEKPKPIPGSSKGNYVASIESVKYHVPTCRWVNEILPENETWFQTPEEAESRFYEPCGTCLR